MMTFFALAKFYVWLWRLKPPQARPPLTRHNLSLGLIDLLASAALLWACKTTVPLPVKLASLEKVLETRASEVVETLFELALAPKESVSLLLSELTAA